MYVKAQAAQKYELNKDYLRVLYFLEPTMQEYQWREMSDYLKEVNDDE